MKKIIFLLLALMLASGLKSQDEIISTKSIKSHFFNAGLISGPGIGYGQMLTERIAFEFDAGILTSGVNLTYYFTKPRDHKLSLYTGLTGQWNINNNHFYYLPVGLAFYGKKNFAYLFDVGIKSSDYISLISGDEKLGPWLGFKVAYQFGEDIRERATRMNGKLSIPKNIISAQAGVSDVAAGIIYERLLTPFWGVEAGIGLIGASVGTKFYFPSITKGHVNFHVGAIQSVGTISSILNESKGLLYLPIGINIMTDRNMRFSFDIGPRIFRSSYITEGSGYYFSEFPGFTLRLGYAF